MTQQYRIQYFLFIKSPEHSSDIKQPQQMNGLASIFFFTSKTFSSYITMKKSRI